LAFDDVPAYDDDGTITPGHRLYKISRAFFYWMFGTHGHIVAGVVMDREF
jgi:hypothetical protein